MNRPLRLVLGGVLVACALACGGGGAPTASNTTGTSTTAPTPTPPPPPAPVAAPVTPPAPTRDQLIAKSKEVLAKTAGGTSCSFDGWMASAENMASAPGGTGTTLLGTGTRVEVVGAVGEYVLVAASPSMNLMEPGWIHATSLSVKPKENLNMRSGQNSGKATGLARRDREANVLSCAADNVKIRTGNDEGWVDAKSVCGNSAGCN